jgi:hypothetical protein
LYRLLPPEYMTFISQNCGFVALMPTITGCYTGANPNELSK